jgi:hypothetical protein
MGLQPAIRQPNFGPSPRDNRAATTAEAGRVDGDIRAVSANDNLIDDKGEDDEQESDVEESDKEGDSDEDDPDSSFEGTGRRTKKERKAKAEAKKSNGSKAKVDYNRALVINLPISSLFTLQQFQHLVEAFALGLRELEFRFTRNNQAAQATKLSPAEVMQISSLLFEHIFALRGARRINALITEYRVSGEGSNPKSAAQRAGRIVEEENVAPLIRRFMISYQACSAREEKRNSIMDTVDTIWNSYQLYRHYLALVDGKEGQDRLRAFLATCGFTMRQGYGWTSCVHDYLISSLELSRSELKNFL